MDKCEKLFEELKIRPLVGIIPENRDPDLLRFQKIIISGVEFQAGRKMDGRYQCMVLTMFMIQIQSLRIF